MKRPSSLFAIVVLFLLFACADPYGRRTTSSSMCPIRVMTESLM